MTTEHAAVLAAADSRWDVEPLKLMFRNPEPPTIQLRAQRTDVAADPVVMTIELTEADLVSYEDGQEVLASLLSIVTNAAGRMVADLRSRGA